MTGTFIVILSSWIMKAFKAIFCLILLCCNQRTWPVISTFLNLLRLSFCCCCHFCHGYKLRLYSEVWVIQEGTVQGPAAPSGHLQDRTHLRTWFPDNSYRPKSTSGHAKQRLGVHHQGQGVYVYLGVTQICQRAVFMHLSLQSWQNLGGHRAGQGHICGWSQLSQGKAPQGCQGPALPDSTSGKGADWGKVWVLLWGPQEYWGFLDCLERGNFS